MNTMRSHIHVCMFLTGPYNVMVSRERLGFECFMNDLCTSKNIVRVVCQNFCDIDANTTDDVQLYNTNKHTYIYIYRGGAGGVLDHESRGKKTPFHSFTMKINTFHVSRRKTHANSTMTCIKCCKSTSRHIPE